MSSSSTPGRPPAPPTSRRFARALVRRAKGWQVWSVERRENLLEDQSVAELAKEGKAARQLFNYYLGWINNLAITRHFIPDSRVEFAKRWGMRVEIQDLRRVVKAAEACGGRVVVMGHSLGGTITTAYATWDFGGTPGAKGMSGLVYDDGGSGPKPLVTAAEARQALADLDQPTSSPWLAFGGIGAPFAGLFAEGGSVLSIAADRSSRSPTPMGPRSASPRGSCRRASSRRCR